MLRATKIRKAEGIEHTVEARALLVMQICNRKPRATRGPREVGRPPKLLGQWARGLGFWICWSRSRRPSVMSLLVGGFDRGAASVCALVRIMGPDGMAVDQLLARCARGFWRWRLVLEAGGMRTGGYVGEGDTRYRAQLGGGRAELYLWTRAPGDMIIRYLL